MRSYTFFETAIGVTTDAGPVADWLDEFLVPAFGRTDRSDVDVDVHVHVGTDAAAHAGIAESRPPGDLASVACFALDREVVRHPAWTTSGRTVAADAKYGVFYVLDGARVDVVIDPRSLLFRTGAMRVIREIATARTLTDPRRLQLHAAAFEVDGRAVLVAGAKGSGKTTLLAYVAHAVGAGILGNDRAIVATRGDGFAVRGVPTIVSVRPDTHALVPCLFDGLTALERPAHMTLDEVDAARPAGAVTGAIARLKLSPAQLARQLGVSLSAEGALAAIVFPSADPHPEGFAVDRLTADEARVHLLVSRFGLGAAKTDPTIFDRFARARRSADADAALIDTVASAIPCFAVRLGAGRFRAPAAAEALKSAILPRGADG